MRAALTRRLGFLRGGLVRQGMRLVVGTAAGQAFVVVMTPVLTRLYSPAEFGVLGIFAAFLNASGVLASCRYETAIPAATDEDAEDLLVLALCIAVPFSFAAGAVLFGLKKANFMSYGILSSWMCAAAIPAIFGSSAIESLRFWLVRLKRFGDVGRILMRQGAGKAVVPLFLKGTGSMGGGLVIGEIVGRLLGVSRPLADVMPVLRRARISYDGPKLRALLKHYWKLPVINTPSSLVDVFSMSLPVVLIAGMYGPARAGLFLLVQRVISLPTSLVGTSVADVFHVRLAEVVSYGRPRMRKLVHSTARRLLFIGGLFILPVALAAPFVAAPLFGPSWKEAGRLTPILAPWALAGLTVSPLSRVLTVTLDLQLKLIYDFTALALLLFAAWLASATNMEFFAGVLTISLLRSVAYVVYYVVILSALPAVARVAQDGPSGTL